MSLEWIGILLCIIHSALFSGLNLGFFGLSKLRLSVQAENNNRDAARILKLRSDAHLLLSTLLWGNVASNVLLALFSESIFSGVGAFLFSTIGITFFGEILPQAYLVKHTLKASRFLVPIIKFYQILLYPLAKPTGLFLDKWLGKETISYFQEDEVEVLLKQHAQSLSNNLTAFETTGAINFLQLDDILFKDEGELIKENSIIILPRDNNGDFIFPDFKPNINDSFLKKINASHKKWVLFIDENDTPGTVLDSDQFLRDVFLKQEKINPKDYCHTPIIITDFKTKLGAVVSKLSVNPINDDDDVVDHDLIICWGKQKRVITGADILGRLLRGITRRISLRDIIA